MKKGLSVFVCDEQFSGREIEGLNLKHGDAKDADMVFNCFALELGLVGRG
jgi:hypothetical protein